MIKKASEVVLKKIKVVEEEEAEAEENGGGEEEVAIGEQEERIGEEETMMEDKVREEGEVLLSGLVHFHHFRETPFLFSQHARAPE